MSGVAWLVGLMMASQARAAPVEGRVRLRTPGDPADGAPVVLSLRDELAEVVWDGLPEQRRRRRRGRNVIASRANLFDPLLVQIVVVGAEVWPVSGWRLFHGLTPWIPGSAVLEGGELRVDGEAGQTLADAICAGGGSCELAVPVALELVDGAAGEWRLVTP